jgi:diguanylate cyclase (GGDEF)-like protein
MRLVQNLAEAVDPGAANPTLPTVRRAVIHFDHAKEMTPGNVLACLAVALSDPFHESAAVAPLEFEAGKICVMREFPWMMVDVADQMLRLGSAYDRFAQLAQTDCVSQLPNARAAVQEIETSLAAARTRGGSFSLLMIDGDNLRRFNTVSYAAGDEAIRQIAAALRMQLREDDFLARFRSGDEFVVLLRDIPYHRALHIAGRLCRAVERASRAWLFPTTISIGAAHFPSQGETVTELLHAAETGLALAKQRGKNQVVSIRDEPTGGSAC